MTTNMKEHRKRLEGIHQLLERKSRLEARVRLVSSSSLMNTTSQHIILADISQVMSKEESVALADKLRFKSDNASLLYIKAITNLINGSK